MTTNTLIVKPEASEIIRVVVPNKTPPYELLVSLITEQIQQQTIETLAKTFLCDFSSHETTRSRRQSNCSNDRSRTIFPI